VLTAAELSAVGAGRNGPNGSRARPPRRRARAGRWPSPMPSPYPPPGRPGVWPARAAPEYGRSAAPPQYRQPPPAPGRAAAAGYGPAGPPGYGRARRRVTARPPPGYGRVRRTTTGPAGEPATHSRAVAG